jgi:DNA-binding HxlR family transcriptional regulator
MHDKKIQDSCPATIAMNILQGKWRIQILCVMQNGPIRLGQLGRLIPSASKKVLAENLRKLESSGLIVRTDLSSHVLRVEYDLSEHFKASTHELLDYLSAWGQAYKEETSGSQNSHDSSEDGRSQSATSSCDRTTCLICPYRGKSA